MPKLITEDDYGNSKLYNCTCNIANEGTVSNLNEIVFTANTGYEFDNNLVGINLYISNSLGIRISTLSLSSYAILSADKTKITFTQDYTQGSQWVLSGTIRAVQKTTTTGITLTVNSTFTNVASHNFNTGDVITESTDLKVFSNDGYVFNQSNQTITFDGTETRNFILASNKVQLYCNITVDDINTYTTAVIDGDFIAEQESTKVLVTIAENALVNCTADFSNGEELTNERYLTITANSGYEFNGTFMASDNINGDIALIYNGKTQLRYHYYPNTGITYVNFIDTYTATVAPTETLSEFVRIFNPTDEELSALSKSTFYNLVSGSSVPISSYITALYKLPFDVSRLRIADKANIVLGNYDSNVTSTMLDSWVLETDGGQIEVVPKYNDVFDYINIDCSIYIPYFGKADIDTERVMGQTLTVTYYTNLYEGMVTVDVESTFGGNKVFTATKKVGFDIPYVQLSAVSAITEVNIPILENSTVAFVEVVRNIPIVNSETFGKKTVKISRVSDLSGYQIIDDIKFIGALPDNVQTEIRQILRGGCFI